MVTLSHTVLPQEPHRSGGGGVTHHMIGYPPMSKNVKRVCCSDISSFNVFLRKVFFFPPLHFRGPSSKNISSICHENGHRCSYSKASWDSVATVQFLPTEEFLLGDKVYVYNFIKLSCSCYNLPSQYVN